MKNLKPVFRTAIGIAVLLIPGVGLSAQNCMNFAPIENLVIQLDDRGVQSFKYTNPRRPFPLAEPNPHEETIGKECKALWKINAARSGISIASDDSSRVFVATIAFDLPLKTQSHSGCSCNVDTLEESDCQAESEQEVMDQEQDIQESSASLDFLSQRLLEQIDLFHEAESKTSRESRLQQASGKLKELDSLAFKYQADPDLSQAAVSELNSYLKSSGSSYIETLNDYAKQLEKGDAETEEVLNTIRSIAADSIKIDLVRQATEGPDKVIPGGPFSCDDTPKNKNGELVKSCSWTWRLNFGFPEPIDPRVLVLNSPRLEMTVSFLDSADSPENSKAYLLTALGSEETASATRLTINGLVGFKKDPDTTPVFDPETEDQPDFLSPTDPYDGRELERFNGSGDLELARNLGDRADATVNISFKKADLGAGEDLDPKVSKYQFRAYGQSGLGLRFGRFSFAKPTAGLAINQFGEGFQFLYNDLKVGYLLRKESLDGKADFEDDDSEVYIAEWNGLGEIGGIRSGTLYGLYGNEKQIAQDYDYWTLGAEVKFSLIRDRTDHKDPEYAAVGKLSLFRSERNLGRQCVPVQDMPDEDCDPTTLVGDGSGTSALLSLSLSRLIPKPKSKTTVLAPEIYTLTFGYASGDDPATLKDEGYLGENAGFGGLGSVFGSFLSKMDPEDHSQIGSGLANKNFVGLDIVTARRKLSPLWWITKRLDLAGDVKSSKTTFSLREIRFTEEVLGSKDAGREASIQWQIEVPKGVVTTLSYGKFFPGDSLETILTSDPSVLQASVQVKIK